MSSPDNTDSRDDEVFHPLGETWQTELEEMLDDTEYDTQLGIDMARDAMRVTKGELSEAEFHEKYHEDVLEEFDVDDRPTKDAYEAAQDEGAGAGQAFADALKKLGGDGDVDRREAMKKMGAAGAAVGFGAWATNEDARPSVQDDAPVDVDEEGERQWGMVIDLERCDGCLQCVIGCQDEHNWDPGSNWMYVMAWEDDENPVPDDAAPGEMNFLVRPCQHCNDAPCEKVCPTTARHTRDYDGLVLTDYDVCIGCRYCQVACPYGVNYFQWAEPDVTEEEIREENEDVEGGHLRDARDRPVSSRAQRGTMSKCTFCPTRQDGLKGEDQVGTTACEEACAEAGMNVIHFGDMNDPESKPNQYLQAREELAREQGATFEDRDEDYFETTTETGNLSTFALLEDMGTDPNIVYIGNQPGAEAKQTDGPVDYSDQPMTGIGRDDQNHVDRKQDVLDDKTVDGGLY
ncbi:4Fe-4S ferredoxin N-terminal domain-containing protein [Natrialbaceae archaeon GCM10025810]|uniref:4Fe-4S ferredoxin N-terminal domain-containing protein n=1 Tax=Halovalidus salilacus TaxID=3075124 RepID=UPI003605B8C8